MFGPEETKRKCYVEQPVPEQYQSINQSESLFDMAEAQSNENNLSLQIIILLFSKSSISCILGLR